MGILESRTLDFENVIISSVNESTLPAGKKQNSFIPIDIKRKFELPTHLDKDAIFAYHFYRLLQRSKHISIIYNTKVDQLKGGEKSRFIEQIIYELPKMNPKVSLNHELINFQSKSEHLPSIIIQKTESIRQKIIDHLNSGISPSAINTFLNCPLDYYYKYIARLKEEELIEEQIEDSTIGTLVHNSLENLYQPFLKKTLSLADIEVMMKGLEQELLRQFREILNAKPDFGNHKLTYEVC